ncbi:glycosyltransferase [Oricola sp.]|uniref:glycosyltransferase n=1 Tax=Oricola sp. TaxID=1979950 RepID=UPI003BAC5672
MGGGKKPGQVALLMLGTHKPFGGMSQYFSAWAQSLKSQGRLKGVIGAHDVVKSVDGVDAFLFDTQIDRLGYKRFIPYLVLTFHRTRKEIRALSRQLREKQIDEVWLVDDFLFSSLYVGVLGKSLAGRVQVTIHDPVPHEGHTKSLVSTVLYRLNRWCLRQLARRDKIVLHFHEPELIKGLSWESVRSKVFSSHPFPAALTKRKRTEDERFRIAFAGRIEPYKGLGVLIDALRGIDEHSPQLAKRMVLSIAGRGAIDHPFADVLLQSERADFQNRFLEDIEFHQVIADTDCLVLPYLSATSSGVALLALTYSVPFIVTDVGDLPRIANLSPLGRIVRANDVESLKLAIEDVFRTRGTNSLRIEEKPPSSVLRKEPR